jgi:hypothetical protein
LKLDQIGTGLAPECATRRKAFDFHGFMQHLTITSNGSGPEPLPNYSRAEKFGSKPIRMPVPRRVMVNCRIEPRVSAA